MRIDYSEPKKSCSSPQGVQSRPRRESSGGLLIVAAISGLLFFGIGFGSGWMLSQRSAKEGFKAAMEQQSLENSPQQAAPLPLLQKQPTPAPGQQPPAAGAASQPATADGGRTTADPPLSFYKTLPSGQKSTVLGSGINTRSDKPAKQPLQAAVPTNINRPAPSDNDDGGKSQAAPAKPAGRQDSSGFTVQVASYSLKSEAETVRSKLAAKGYHVSIIESHLGDKGTWYRVRVGRHLDPDAAKELAERIGKGAISIPDKN